MSPLSLALPTHLHGRESPAPLATGSSLDPCGFAVQLGVQTRQIRTARLHGRLAPQAGVQVKELRGTHVCGHVSIWSDNVCTASTRAPGAGLQDEAYLTDDRIGEDDGVQEDGLAEALQPARPPLLLHGRPERELRRKARNHAV